MVRRPVVVSYGSVDRRRSRTSDSWTASAFSPSACRAMMSLVDVGVHPVHQDQLAEQPEPDPLARELQRARLLQAFPRRRQREGAGVDHGAAEERPAGHDQVVGVGDEHALGVDAVTGAVAGAGGVGQDEGEARHVRRRRLQRDDAQRLEPEALAAPVELLVRRELPRRRPLRHDRVADADRHVQELREIARELEDRVALAPPVGAVARVQPHLGARLGKRPGGLVDREGPVARTDPAERGRIRGAGRPRHHLDGVGDEEAGEQADAELPQEVTPGHREVVALRGAADHRQELAHVVGGEPDAVVPDDQRVRSPRRLDLDEAVDVVAELRPGGDGVAGVLHELAQVDPLTAVEVMAQDIDEASKVDPELLAHCRPRLPAASTVSLRVVVHYSRATPWARRIPAALPRGTRSSCRGDRVRS